MFSRQGKAAQYRGSLAHLSPAWAGPAVADDAGNAFVWLKACVSSKGRWVVFDVVAVLCVGSLWVRQACCLSCDFLKLLNCKRTKKKVAKF